MGPEAISVSQINLYLTCSLKYRFQYVDRLPWVIKSANVVFGSAIHAALEWLHKERKRGRNPPAEEVLRVFEADWHAQILGQQVVYPDDDEQGEKLVLKGKELLLMFYNLPAVAVREAELHFQLPLVNPATGEVLDLPLRGVIDLVRADDTIDEFKASAKRFALADLPDKLQLTTYSYAFEKLFGRKPKELRLVNLVRTKSPAIDIQITGRDERDYERLFHLGREMLNGIRNSVFIPNRGCWMCRDCEYQEDCFGWTGNEDLGELQAAGH
jgi:CRISPR/Cas system-associated exonuclease Cas4 (RecB family)